MTATTPSATATGPVSVRRRDDGTVFVDMSRPEVRNAFDEAMIATLDETFAQLGADRGVRAIVLGGQGRAFSAGADLAWMKRASAADAEWNLADARRFASMLDRIASCSKPTIARVHGVALGGGVGLACACDVVVASASAQFAVSEARFGILPAVIGPYLVNAVGQRQARRLALSAARIDAREALDIGLAHRVVPDDALDATVEALVVELRTNGPQALAEIKALYATLAPGPVTAEVRERTAQAIARVRATAEAREGFEAFFEKRRPPWCVD